MERENTIGYKIRLIHNQIHRRMEAGRRADECKELTGMQRWMLSFLKEHQEEEIDQRDIEVAFSISRATASNMLSSMERKALIERVAVSHDARLKRLILTGRAVDMMEQAQRDIAQMEQLLVKGMSEEEVDRFRQYLDRVLENLGTDI